MKLSDHFSYKRLLKFTFPTIIMMIFTSIYGVVDGFFVSMKEVMHEYVERGIPKEKIVFMPNIPNLKYFETYKKNNNNEYSEPVASYFYYNKGSETEVSNNVIVSSFAHKKGSAAFITTDKKELYHLLEGQVKMMAESIPYLWCNARRSWRQSFD